MDTARSRAFNSAASSSINGLIAPIVPKRFKEFGGVRIDNYDWLRDRGDPRVVAYLSAENAYAEARLESVK